MARYSRWMLSGLAVTLLLCGCGGTELLEGTIYAPGKNEVISGKADTADLCSKFALEPDCDLCVLFGWYGDGTCDQKLIESGECAGPDPDCDQQPDPVVPAPDYPRRHARVDDALVTQMQAAAPEAMLAARLLFRPYEKTSTLMGREIIVSDQTIGSFDESDFELLAQQLQGELAALGVSVVDSKMAMGLGGVLDIEAPAATLQQVLSTTALPGVMEALPRGLSFEIVATGFKSGILEDQELVIDSAEDWEAFYSRYLIGQNDPNILAVPVDYTSEVLLAAFRYDSTWGGKNVEFLYVVEKPDFIEATVMYRALIGCYVLIDPPQSVHQIVKIPRSAKPVQIRVIYHSVLCAENLPI